MRPARVLLFALPVALLLPAAPAAAESLYKCDAGGAITIQSDPCPRGATQVWQRETTPDPGPSAEELAARAALATAEAERDAEQARLARQARIEELLLRDEESRARAAEAGGERPARKSGCTLAHEFADAANAKEWLNLSETQRARLRNWVIDECRDPIGNPTEAPAPPAADV